MKKRKNLRRELAERLYGKVRSGKQVGKRTNCLQMYRSCIDCGVGRWLRITNKVYPRCQSCALRKLRREQTMLVLAEYIKNGIKVKHSRELNKKGGHYLIQRTCLDCGKKQWVQWHSKDRKCGSCSHKHLYGSKAGNWQGGRGIGFNGYVRLFIPDSSPYYSMAVPNGFRGGNVMEHRLVMAKALSRPLTSQEIVHHKNGVRSDNRLCNLTLQIPSKHGTSFGTGYQEGFKEGYNDGFVAMSKRGDYRGEIRV